jgi:hypothetical protein
MSFVSLYELYSDPPPPVPVPPYQLWVDPDFDGGWFSPDRRVRVRLHRLEDLGRGWGQYVGTFLLRIYSGDMALVKAVRLPLALGLKIDFGPMGSARSTTEHPIEIVPS